MKFSTRYFDHDATPVVKICRSMWLDSCPCPCPIWRCFNDLWVYGKTDIFDRAIGTFAQLYADQAEKDYEMFLNAIKSGEIKTKKEK